MDMNESKERNKKTEQKNVDKKKMSEPSKG